MPYRPGDREQTTTTYAPVYVKMLQRYNKGQIVFVPIKVTDVTN